jgi:O-methyltransferase involved in polyketide biosynthesis
MPCAELLASGRTRGVFRWTNAIHDFARRFRPEAPVLRASLVQRHQVLDDLVAAAANPQVLELAAGLSPRGAAMSAHVRYVEVDLPQVVDFKRKQLATSEAGRAVLDRESYVLVGGDATTMDLSELLVADQPVTLVTEGLLMYLDAEARRAFWARMHALLVHPDSLLVFDLTPKAEEPEPGALGRFLGRLMRLFTKGRGFEPHRTTREEIRRDVEAAGFAVEVFDPTSPPAGTVLLQRQHPTQFVVWRCVPAPVAD